MRRAQTALLVGTSLSVAAWACSSTPPPSPLEPVAPTPVASAAQPVAPPVPVPVPPPTASTDASPPATASDQPEPTRATADSPQRGSLARSPIDILTSPDTAFLIDYAGSAPVEAARRMCAEKSGGEPAAQAKCLSDARDAFKADVIRFRKDGSHWSWTVYKRAGNRLEEVTSGRVTLTEASPSSVNIKFVTDKGTRPVLKNKREAVVAVPNDYSFEVDDAEWGKLVYDAKIGLVAN
jgi:hypothetical protein